MKAKNLVKLSFYSRSVNEGFARGALAAFLAQADPTVPELADVKTAVSEAVTNCIVHAYAGGEGEIEIFCNAEGDTVHIRISDSGKGIEDVVRAVEPFFTTLEEEERSGMGFTIMQTFMTSFRLQSAPGQGTTVYMSKKFSVQAEERSRADAV